MAILNCKDLSIGYDNNVVVGNLNFEIESGDYLAVVGENGAGKSTLVKTLLDLVKPISGRIILGDGLSRKEIGYLPQQTVAQKDFPASVFEVVISGCLAATGLRPFYNKREKDIARANIERMGLSGLEKRSYRELSGGQQQRVLIARALCATRKLLLLDEPVAGLDPKVTVETYELIDGLNKDGATIIMISHDIRAAVRYANKILHIGEVPFFGSSEEYLSSDLGKAFLKLGGENDE